MYGCNSDKFSLIIDNQPVPHEIYNYFLSKAENDEAYKTEKDKDKIAVDLCKKYVAESKIIKDNKITLSAEEKVSVAADTKAQWQLFGGFYEKNGVSKQTLNEIIEHSQLVDEAIITIYSDGEKAVSEKDIKKFYNKNYIAIELISADFTDENGNPADDARMNEITDAFKEMRDFVRTGESFESVAQRYPELADYSGEASVITSFDSSYPVGLFKNISELDNGSTQVYKYNRSIYLVYRLPAEENQSFYSLYSKDCIIRMKKSEFEKTVNALAEKSKVVYNNKD
ncbi:MAG: hypothetical protein MJ147_06265 [Clostridia bacterium]|nr:hypothetical protein [Clostridia bacterium]